MATFPETRAVQLDRLPVVARSGGFFVNCVRDQVHQSLNDRGRKTRGDAGIHKAATCDAEEQGASRQQVDPRNQIRRLPASNPSERGEEEGLHPEWSRLDQRQRRSDPLQSLTNPSSTPKSAA